MTSAPVLVYHSLGAKTRLTTDASPVGLGAVLEQEQTDGSFKPVWYASVVRSAGTSGGPSKKKKHPLPARSNAASSLEESRQRYKVSTFGSSGLRTNSGLCRGLKSLQVVPRRVQRTHFLFVINIFVRAFCFCCVLVEFFLLFLSWGCVTT